MNKIILIFMVLLMSVSFAIAFPVDISYTDSSSDGKPIVADVPFDVTVYMNTNNNDVLSYNLYVTRAGAQALFTSASRGQLFPENDLDANSGAQSDNAIYRYQVKPKVGYVGTSNAAASLFTLRTKISGVAPSTIELTKQNGVNVHADNVITPAASDVRVETINDLSREITPSLSVCGDGVVGYFDVNNNGIKETAEAAEVCDDGNTAGSTLATRYATAKDGCSSDCRVVDLGYSCTNTVFGDRGSRCTILPAKDFLVQKLTSLINGQCYPNCNHPAALYVNPPPSVAPGGVAPPTPRLTYDTTTNPNGKLDSSEKIYMIAQIGVALREFFSQTVQS